MIYLDFWNNNVMVQARQNGHIVAKCPSCDKDKHFYANITTGAWDCKVCGQSGNAITFLRDFKNFTGRQIFDELDRYGIQSERGIDMTAKTEPKIFSQKAVDYYVQKLTPEKLSEFAKERGLSPEILKKYQLGMNDAGEFTLPVYDSQGRIRNILRKQPGGTISSQGGEALVFGIDNFSNKGPIFVCEGPWSAMALIQRGFAAIGTCGAGVIKAEQVDLFKGKDIYIVPDNDPAGLDGAKRLKTKLSGIANVYEIAPVWPEKADIRNFFNAGGSVETIERMVKRSRETKAPVETKKLSPVPSYDEFIDQVFPPLEYLIGSDEAGVLLQKDAITAITAEFGKGKTLFALNMAWAITKGEGSFLGFPVKKGRGLYLIFEGGNPSFQKRLKAIGRGQPNPDLYVRYVSQAFDLTPGETKTADQIEFEATLEALKLDFVVLDNTANVFSGDENDQKQVKPFMDYLISVGKKYSVSFVILRHWKKTQQKGGSPRRQMATGSIWWMNAVDNQICLSGDADSIILSSEKERNCGTFSPKVITIDKQDLRFKFVKDFASNGPRFTEDNTLMPAWESFGADRVKQSELIDRMTGIIQSDGKSCSEPTAKIILQKSPRFLRLPIVPGSTKSGNWVTLKPEQVDGMFNYEDADVS